VASGVPGGSVAVSCFYDVVGPHNPSDSMFARDLARFAQVKKDTRGTIDAVARCRGRADQAEQPLILQRPIGEGVTQPVIEPAARHVEEPAHDGRIKLPTMGLDERVLHSDTLRSVPITHGPSPCSNDHQQGVR
jgi:hypothetical protein